MIQSAGEIEAGDGAEVRRMLRDSARSFFAERLNHDRIRQLRVEPTGAPSEVWDEMIQLGWSGLIIGEENGGSGLGLSEMAVVLEELGRVAAFEPLTATAVLAAKVIAESDQLALKSGLLSGIAQGTILPAVAWQEEARLGEDDARSTTQARRVDAGWCVRGAKCFVQPGGAWTGLIVSAMAQEGLVLLWVPRSSKGIDVQMLRQVDGSTCVNVLFSDVDVPSENLLASSAAAKRALQTGLDFARLGAAAELLGVVRGVLEVAFEYLRTREQFGVKIGTFQALRHRAVDLFLQQELLSASLNEACAVLDVGHSEDLPMIAARVKARASSAALLATKEAVQMHGAMGYTDECDVGLYLKRALSLSAWLGNAAELRLRHAPACLADNRPFA